MKAEQILGSMECDYDNRGKVGAPYLIMSGLIRNMWFPVFEDKMDLKHSQTFLRFSRGRFAGFLIWASVTIGCCLAQGPLAPTGPPRPIMKTLDQIEPRIGISAAPYVITNSGSYYLTTNLYVGSGNAIVISTNDVSLNLNGYTISSDESPPTGYGIIINSGLRNITIENGVIKGFVTNDGHGNFDGVGFRVGIGRIYPVYNVYVKNVTVVGCAASGIYLGENEPTVIEDCAVEGVGAYGLAAGIVKNSLAYDCKYGAVLGGTIYNCWGSSFDGPGVDGAEVVDCVGESVSGVGISGKTLRGCLGNSERGIGISGIVAEACFGSSSSGYGLLAHRSAIGCIGTSVDSAGVFSDIARVCYGLSINGIGINARTAQGSYGQSSNGIGIQSVTAILSVGNRSSGRAIQASLAVSSYALSGTNYILLKYNMP